MSMNFSEFKRLIGADPWNREPETLRARNSSPEFEEAASEAESFERKLQGAVNLPPPADLLDDIKAISRQSPSRNRWMPLALAASLVIAVGAVGIVWKQANRWDSVESYLAEHYAHDGAELVASATQEAPKPEVHRIMASLNASADPSLSEKIRFIKFCPTPDGKGAHMVVNTPQGPLTVIFMPATDVNDGEMVEFEQMHAFLVDLEHGSAAIIGDRTQPVEQLEPVIRTAIRTGIVGA